LNALQTAQSWDAYYYLTPLPRQALRAEITGTSKTSGFNGTQLNLNYRNRNRFHAGEQLSINTYMVQRSV
jgi:hypothetical protein